MVQLKPSTFCPLVQGDCKQLGCSWFTQMRGTHPQTGEPVDEWGCAVTWLPVLLVENAKEARHGASAIESFRNEVTKAQYATANAISAAANIHLLEAQP
jgi:hypothetical protein